MFRAEREGVKCEGVGLVIVALVTKIESKPVGDRECDKVFRDVWAPGRAARLLLVKLDPGKTDNDFAAFFDQVDQELERRGKKKRHDQDIHERQTYRLKGDYDLAVLWDAPSEKAADDFVAIWLRNGRLQLSPGGPGTGTSISVDSAGRYG